MEVKNSCLDCSLAIKQPSETVLCVWEVKIAERPRYLSNGLMAVIPTEMYTIDLTRPYIDCPSWVGVISTCGARFVTETRTEEELGGYAT